MEVRRENNTEWVKRSLLYREYSAELEEVLLHKWIESEKVGYDIGFERALVDWHLKYRSIWRAKRMRRRSALGGEASDKVMLTLLSP
jgi:hypothetical protein